MPPYHQVNMMSVISWSMCRLSSCLYAAYHHFNMTPVIMAISGPSSALYATHNHVHVLSAIISLCRPSSGQCYAPRQVFFDIMPSATMPICFLLSGQGASPHEVNMPSSVRSICRPSLCPYDVHHRFNMSPVTMSVYHPSSHTFNMPPLIMFICYP